MRATEPRPPGRPTLLDDELADRLVALLESGASITDAAFALGVSRRSVERRRARAWSREPRDAPFVELERRLRDVLAAQRIETPSQATGFPELEDVSQIVARFDDPLGWAPFDDGGTLDAP